MPYIKQEDRYRLDDRIDFLADEIKTVGELNYTITRLCHQRLKKFGINYEKLSAINGVLSDVKDELYRKVVVPYEEKKILENGDIGVLPL